MSMCDCVKSVCNVTKIFGLIYAFSTICNAGRMLYRIVNDLRCNAQLCAHHLNRLVFIPLLFLLLPSFFVSHSPYSKPSFFYSRHFSYHTLHIEQTIYISFLISHSQYGFCCCCCSSCRKNNTEKLNIGYDACEYVNAFQHNSIHDF